MERYSTRETFGFAVNVMCLTKKENAVNTYNILIIRFYQEVKQLIGFIIFLTHYK